MASHAEGAAGAGASGALGTSWPAPDEEGYGTMHETFDRHWVECAKEIEEYSPFYPWWRMVQPHVLAGVRETDEIRDDEVEWKPYVKALRLSHIAQAVGRIKDPTEHAIKLDALSHYEGWYNYPNW